MWSGSKVMAWTDRHTDGQIDRHDWKQYLHAYAGGKNIALPTGGTVGLYDILKNSYPW